MKRSDELVVVEQTFQCSRLALWQALTDTNRMRQWFFKEIPEFKAEKGFTTEFMIDAGERQFLHQWEVTEVVPEKKIAYRWRYQGYPGAALSVFELSGDANTANLRISFPVEEDFPDDIPEFKRDSCVGGWDYFIKQQLTNYLDA